MEYIEANLTKTVSFFKRGKEVIIPVDAVIQVYPKDTYAVWHGIHFEIFRDEYVLTV